MTHPQKPAYLTIHGHFYQPPRENPWTGKIELQPSAHPYHDWNERILVECYQPNAMARIMDSEGRVLEIVNNYRLLSFNAGPTLLDWMARQAPVVYHRIQEGDRKSAAEHSGHGNAIAQVYNHMILPLAEERDQRTQIRWGIGEFKKRFGRDPEGLWLPETAARNRTLELLLEEGIRFTILAPSQAEKIRRIGSGGDWHDVSDGSIDPASPYRFFHTDGSGRFIDLFFYDLGLSRDLGFGELLFDAGKFLDRLKKAAHGHGRHPHLIHTASDGETFGHHKAYGERVIAYLLHRAAEEHGFKRTNYGEFLEKFPPEHEVLLKPGEGTSWSCAHGVGRWKQDCGCQGGGKPEWHKTWRGPLREAVRFLEKEIGEIYEREAGKIFKDPWRARDESIEIILDRSPDTRKHFLHRQFGRPLSAEEEIRAMKLLEMTRFALLSETSCGWFFSEISGIETVQILRYACRALDLAAEFAGADPENRFLEILAPAKSNVEEFRDGRGVWEQLVRPARVTMEKIAAHFAFRKLFEFLLTQDNFFGMRVTEGESEQEKRGDTSLLMGTVELTGQVIPECREFMYAVIQRGISEIRCYVRRVQDVREFRKFTLQPLSLLRKGQNETLLKNLDETFENAFFRLRDLFPEERDRILGVLSREMQEDYYQSALRLYEENRAWAVLFKEAGRPLPEQFKTLIEWAMGERLILEVKRFSANPFVEEPARRFRELQAEAEAGGFSIRMQPTVEFLLARMNAWIEKLSHEKELPLPLLEKMERVFAIARELHLELYHHATQELFFIFAQRVLPKWIEAHRQDPQDASRLKAIHSVIELGKKLGLNMERYEALVKN